MQFQLFNIPITIRLSFWPFLLFCSLDANPIYMALLAVIFAGSLLIHELGHGLAALKWGASPAITLEAFGGYTSFSRSIDEKKHFLITLAGPLFTAFLIALAYYLLKSRLFESYWPNVFCYMLMRLNIYWLLINLAPLRPLDGGKMAAYFFQKYGGRYGERLSFWLGHLTALAGVVYFLLQGNYVFSLLFASYGLKNFQKGQFPLPPRASSNSFALLNEAALLSREEEFEKAGKLLKKLARSKDEYIRNHAVEGLAALLEKQGKEKEAYHLLLKADPSKMRIGCQLLIQLAYSQGHYEKAAEYANVCYQASPSLEIALLNAKSFARMGNKELAQGWLHTARQFEEAQSMDWEPILADPIFAERVPK